MPKKIIGQTRTVRCGLRKQNVYEGARGGLYIIVDGQPKYIKREDYSIEPKSTPVKRKK